MLIQFIFTILVTNHNYFLISSDKCDFAKYKLKHFMKLYSILISILYDHYIHVNFTDTNKNNLPET